MDNKSAASYTVRQEIESQVFQKLQETDNYLKIASNVAKAVKSSWKFSEQQKARFVANLNKAKPKNLEELKQVLVKSILKLGFTEYATKEKINKALSSSIEIVQKEVLSKLLEKDRDGDESVIEDESEEAESVSDEDLDKDLSEEEIDENLDSLEERATTAKAKNQSMIEELEEEKLRAAIRIQAMFKGYKARRFVKDKKERMASDPEMEAQRVKRAMKEKFPEEDNKNIRAATVIQSALKGYLARKAYDEMLKMNKLQNEAAVKIQALWRGYRVRKGGKLTQEMVDEIRANAEEAKRAREAAAAEDKRKEDEARAAEDERKRKEAEKQKILDEAFSKRDEKYPKRLDRRQVEREVLAFERKGRRSPFIKGIYGHYDKLVENEPDIEEFHLGIKRHHRRDLIELTSSGFLVAEYQNPIQLQAHIEAARRAHEASKLKGATPLLEKGEVRMMFAKYPSHKYNARGERVATDDQYILLVQTEDGITQSFVDASVVTKKQDEANKLKDNEDYYKNHLSEFLEEEGYFAEVAEGVDPAAHKAAAMERAQHKIRHQIRENVVVAKTTEEIKEGQVRAKKVSRLNGADIDHIIKARKFSLTDKSDRQLLNTDAKFRRKITLFERIADHAISSSDHDGFSINENGHGAYINFNNPKSTIDVCYKAIPGTSYVVRVCVATRDGEHIMYKDGQQITKYCQKGDVLIDENTVHFFDGRDYKPFCVHTNYLEKNIKEDTLKNHKLSKYQGGKNGFKAVQRMYDAFSIVATSDFGGVRKCATKIGKEINNQVNLGTTISLDHEGNDLSIRRKIASIDDIKTVSLQDQAKKSPIDEIIVECPNFSGKKRPEKVKDSAEFNDNLDRIKSFSDDGKIYVKLIRAYSAPGQNSSAHYSNISPRREFYVLKNGKYVALTKEMVAKPDEVPATTPIEEGHGESVRIKLPIDSKKNAEFLEKFTKDFFDEVTVDYKIEDEVAQKEQDLRKAVARNDVETVKKLLDEYSARKKAIEDRIASDEMTSSEAETFRRDLNFDINAKNSNAGENALHIAAKNGNKELVKMLLDAGADARISTAPDAVDNSATKTSGQKALQTAAEYAVGFVFNPFFWSDLLIYGDPLGRSGARKNPTKSAAQIAVEAGNNNKAEKDNMVEILQKSAQERQHEEYAKRQEALKKDVDIYQKRYDKLAKAILDKGADGKDTGLIPELRLVSHQAIAAARAHADALKNDPSNSAKIKTLFEQKTALEEKSRILTQQLREAREKLRQADLVLAVAKEALDKPKPIPPLAKEGLVPTPEKYEVVPYRITYGPDDNKKYFDVNLYLVKEDNAVIQRYRNGKIECVEFPEKGSICFDLNTVHYFGNKDEGGLRTVNMEIKEVPVFDHHYVHLGPKEIKKVPAEIPKEFEGDEELWNQARKAYLEFQKKTHTASYDKTTNVFTPPDLSSIEGILPDDFKALRADRAAMHKAQEEARKLLGGLKEANLRSEIDLALKEFSARMGYITGLDVAAGGVGSDSGHAGDHNPLSNDLSSKSPSDAPGPVLDVEALPEVLERQEAAAAAAKNTKFFGHGDGGARSTRR